MVTWVARALAAKVLKAEEGLHARSVKAKATQVGNAPPKAAEPLYHTSPKVEKIRTRAKVEAEEVRRSGDPVPEARVCQHLMSGQAHLPHQADGQHRRERERQEDGLPSQDPPDQELQRGQDFPVQEGNSSNHLLG